MIQPYTAQKVCAPPLSDDSILSLRQDVSKTFPCDTAQVAYIEINLPQARIAKNYLVMNSYQDVKNSEKLLVDTNLILMHAKACDIISGDVVLMNRF